MSPALYNVISQLIVGGQTDGLSEKVDIFYAVGKLTTEQYTELTKRLEA